jgi:hypothetical protein
MLKYYVDGQEISSKEYEEYIIEDAYDNDESKAHAMRVIKENRQEARETGENIWRICNGAKLVIERI